MAADEPGEERVSEHRPLPSVDMPLLREQRRASRTKQLAVGLGLALGAVAGGIAALLHQGGAWLSGGDARASDKPPAQASAPASVGPDAGMRSPDGSVGYARRLRDAGLGDGGGPPVSDAAVERTVHHFGEARGFRQALRNAGLDRSQCVELEKALGEVMDFRRCRSDDRMVIERDENGDVVRFEYHPDPTEYIVAERAGSEGLAARRVEIPMDVERLARGGIVKTSLGNALVREGLGRKLVRPFLAVFGSRVNFSVDTRSGDEFRIIVDKNYLDGEFHGYGRVHALQYDGKRTGELRAYWFDPGNGRGDYYNEQGRTVSGWLRCPCRYDHISSRFDRDRMHPVLGREVPHLGVDYAAGRGTPIWAAADGVVTFAGHKGANGNLVSVRHDDGYKTHYAHLSRFARGLDEGDRVEQREIIGYMGSTGRSTGPHLHFGVKRGGKYLDPLDELEGPGRRLPPAKRARFKEHLSEIRAELDAIVIDAQGPPSKAE